MLTLLFPAIREPRLMPAKRRHGGRRRNGPYEPGGASCDRLVGILSRHEKRAVAEIFECKCIARWHDATVIASDADPAAFVISSPLQGHRNEGDAPVIYSCFIPRAVLYEILDHDIANLPLGRLDRCCLLAAHQPSDAGPNEPETHLSMRRSEARSVPRKTASPQTIHL